MCENPKFLKDPNWCIGNQISIYPMLSNMANCTVSHNINTTAHVGSSYKNPLLEKLCLNVLLYCYSKNFFLEENENLHEMLNII